MQVHNHLETVERWSVYERAVTATVTGNPFTDHSIRGIFSSKSEQQTVDGFYDGNGVYKVRFMPSFIEEYTYRLEADFLEEPETGSFTVSPASSGNHGPVRVANTFHFAYEDGTPYYSVGTTCYVWTHQPQKKQEQTLQTLAQGYFNKIRFCIFPKHYDYNFEDPIIFPFEGTPCSNAGMTRENFMSFRPDNPENKWDFTRPNPEHFKLIEQRIQDLMDLGIEADLIVMHPYDRWGFSRMSREADDLYWNYVLARFSAFRNVWWSLANEYDILSEKTLADWEHYAELIVEKDPYLHLRSIHHCHHFYDYTRPWVTHCSIQRTDFYKIAELTAEWRERYQKPVVLDEIVYEGNIPHGWGNISGQELVRRFWEATVRGGYAGHGETYLHSENRLWWSHGGALHGDSPSRIRFLHGILEQTPGLGLKPVVMNFDDHVGVPEQGEGYYLFYFGFNRPALRDFIYLDADSDYHVEIIDTWDMTIQDCGIYHGKFQLKLPGKEYIAVRVCKL